ncbi:DUF1775 domain-containing protein [Chelatococcus reniformis]|uniref:YncI copper-binding domain-containing protein n=1 Tax=Chelatococcus reniformis TaxID=1494448 RepID=A0A916URF1_9HYPH|nr:DUF1775 domain-containing protein [Chelatococcus reniformis]GGC84142.1 hypothetical protein GCM10010994_47560 [Chelatococcus reniformis]
MIRFDLTRIALGGALGAATALLSTSVFAHVTLETTEATPNSYYRGVAKVNHGCGTSATKLLRITIPEGVIAARPMPKAGWTVELEKGPYARAYPLHGKDVASGVKSITWKGGSLPDDFYDEFVFAARITDAFQPGATISFPVLQQCESGTQNWAEVPAPGQSAAALKSPAPGVRIIQAATTAPSTAPAAVPVKVGDLTIRSPWARATPAGAKVAGGYLAVTNDGKAADRLIGGSFDIAGEVQIHEMKVEDGVMRMRPLDKGIELPPGQTVELKPGGFHLMLMGLKQQLKTGDTVKGTLVFEKAGSVPVTLAVGGVGAQQGPGGSPAGGHHEH